jgi:PIN domain nuclease of toxin-antitoxin system
MTHKSPRIGRRARRSIDRALVQRELWVSAVSFGEITRLVAKGRLRLAMQPSQFREKLMAMGCRELALTGEQAIDAAGLEGLSPDPVDRYIVAAARSLRGTLVTADAAILEWRGALERHDATI